MSAAPSMDALLARATEASAAGAAGVGETRAEAVAVLRELERRLVAALAGAEMRGLPNLGVPAAPFHGIRVRALGHGAGRYALPAAGRPVLVWMRHGALAMVGWSAAGGVVARLVRDDELWADDLELAAESLRAALERHLAMTERTAVRVGAQRALARDLARALGWGASGS